MWYTSPAENQLQRVLPAEVVASTESDLYSIVLVNVDPVELDPAANPHPNDSTVPGSEYWLP
jgi:hypothetical protein